MKEKSIAAMERIVPRDESLLNLFVEWAAKNGLPARWYYINQSRDLLLNQIKGVLARDLVGYDAFIEILNKKDVTIDKARSVLKSGEAKKMLEKNR